MRKNFILAIIILIIISSTSTIVFAQSSLNINVVADKSNLKSGEEIIFSMSLSNMEEIDEGVNAYILTLNYNTEQFDFVKAEGANNWNAPMYNTNTISTGKIKFVSTISNFTKDENEFLKITLKAKQQLSNNDIDITIDNISFAAKVNSETSKVLVDDIKVQLDSKQNSSDNSGNNGSNDNGGTEVNNYNRIESESIDNLSDKPLPYTGLTRFLILVILTIFLISFIIYMRYKNLKKYIK